MRSLQDALAAALLRPVALAGVQQVAQRDDADQFARVVATDDGELGQAGLGHPVDDDAERFVRVGDDGMRLDQLGEPAPFAVIGDDGRRDVPDRPLHVAAGEDTGEIALTIHHGVEMLAAPLVLLPVVAAP